MVKSDMNNLIYLFQIFLVLFFCTHGAFAREDKSYGITRQTHGSSEFTFRNERLVHELTKLDQNWIEIFYDGASPVFVRSGVFKDGLPTTTSERFTGLSKEMIRQASMPGDAHPRRIYVGGEIYNRTSNGFFEIMPNPGVTARESILMGVEFSTRELESLRNSLLKPPQE
jgi:hypothetical protein